MTHNSPWPLRPKPVHRGDLVGLVAPSSPFPREAFDRGIKFLEDKGFRAYIPSGIFDTHRNFLAGKDSDRARTIMEMFINPEVRAIMAIRGGYGSQRLLHLLDPDQIRNHPKIFLGYSDATALLLYLLDTCGIVPFHGPMVVEMGERSLDSDEWLLRAIMQSAPLGSVPLRRSVWIRRGRAKGALVGGNLSVICSTLGTPWEIRTEGRLLFLEERNEKPYKIDRMLNQLHMAGKLRHASGLIFGNIIPQGNSGEVSIGLPFEKEILEILQDASNDFPGPVLWGLPIGHGRENLTLPLGVQGLLDGDQSVFEILEPALEGGE